MQTRARQGRFCVLRLSEQLKNPMMLGQKYVKNLLGFLGDLKTPKMHSDINRPLECFVLCIKVFSKKNQKKHTGLLSRLQHCFQGFNF